MKTVAWSRTEPVVTIGGESATLGSDNGDQPSNDIKTTTTSGGSNSTGDTNGDSSNGVGVYSVSSPRPCRLIAPSASDRDGSARSSSNPLTPRSVGTTSPQRSVGGVAAHDTAGVGGIRFSAGSSDDARYGTNICAVAGNGTTVGRSQRSSAIEEKEGELRPAQAVMPAKVRPRAAFCFNRPVEVSVNSVCNTNRANFEADQLNDEEKCNRRAMRRL